MLKKFAIFHSCSKILAFDLVFTKTNLGYYSPAIKFAVLDAVLRVGVKVQK
jgi:hypothetical protein